MHCLLLKKNLNSTGKIGKWNYSDSDYALLAGIVSKMSVALGAGGIFSSAIDYWNFVNYLTSNKIIPLNDITSNSNNYYDGVYLGQGTFHADGSINGCESCFITNYDSNQTFIFFSNNISFKQMLKIRGKLAKICFE